MAVTFDHDTRTVAFDFRSATTRFLVWFMGILAIAVGSLALASLLAGMAPVAVLLAGLTVVLVQGWRAYRRVWRLHLLVDAAGMRVPEHGVALPWDAIGALWTRRSQGWSLVELHRAGDAAGHADGFARLNRALPSTVMFSRRSRAGFVLGALAGGQASLVFLQAVSRFAPHLRAPAREEDGGGWPPGRAMLDWWAAQERWDREDADPGGVRPDPRAVAVRQVLRDWPLYRARVMPASRLDRKRRNGAAAVVARAGAAEVWGIILLHPRLDTGRFVVADTGLLPAGGPVVSWPDLEAVAVEEGRGIVAGDRLLARPSDIAAPPGEVTALLSALARAWRHPERPTPPPPPDTLLAGTPAAERRAVWEGVQAFFGLLALAVLLGGVVALLQRCSGDPS